MLKHMFVLFTLTTVIFKNIIIVDKLVDDICAMPVH